MSEEKSYLTQAKFNELEAELKVLKTVKRKEIADALEHARSLGDLSENGEYQEAREAQGAVEERIRKIEQTLKNAEIVSHKDSSTVSFGSRVMVKKDKDGSTHTYELVGTEEADMLAKKISHVSPLGQAMMGKTIGDSFEVSTPAGKVAYSIVEVQ